MHRRLALLLLPFVAAGLTAACSKGAPDPSQTSKPIPIIPEITTTSFVDLSGVQLAGVPGKTTTTVGIGPGKATISGTVSGPDGPVGGATIHVERLVGDATASQDFASNADGTFSIPAILGGVYRVRTFVPDPYNLAQGAPALFFLNGDEKKKLDLSMDLFSGLAVKTSVAPSQPIVEEPANLLVQVTSQTVDEKGIVRGEPIPEAKVELFGTGAWAVETTNPSFTDNRGLAGFRVQCRAVGDQPLSAVVNDGEASTNVSVGPCVIPPPTTEPTTTASTAAPTGPTSTTRPAAGGTGSTSTTAGATATTRPPATTTTRPPTTTTRPPTTTTTRR